MSATELRMQLDALRIKKQQLEVKNAHLRSEHPEELAMVNVTKEQDTLQEAKQALETELAQLRGREGKQ